MAGWCEPGAGWALCDSTLDRTFRISRWWSQLVIRDHREPAADPDSVSQARAWSPRVRRRPSNSSLEGEPGGRNARSSSPRSPVDLTTSHSSSAALARHLLQLSVRVAWTVGSFFADFFQELADAFQRQSYSTRVCYIILIYFFGCSLLDGNHLQPQGQGRKPQGLRAVSIPGYRPGRRTEDYLEKVMLRITYVGRWRSWPWSRSFPPWSRRHSRSTGPWPPSWVERVF